jgi:hypothetical protein
MNISNNILKKLFENVYFLNGTAYAGKSTMVKLLAEKYDGICCGENYHMEILSAADPVHQPNLCYFETMSGWQEFVTRSPEEYDAWITNTAREAAELEIILLLRLAAQGKKIFVDTNIPVDVLREISDYDHVAILLSPTYLSVERFFDRPDADKQFLYQELLKCPDPKGAIINYRKCLERINGPEHYREFAESRFFTHLRTENSTIEQTLNTLETHFQLT